MAEFCFADFETRSPLDLLIVGAHRYAHHPETDATVLAFVFNDDPVGQIWSPDWCWDRPMEQYELDHLHDHVRAGGYMIFWNAGFDRKIWNEVMVPKYGWPHLPLEQVLCAQAQGEANNLPGKLEFAAKMLGVAHQKDPQGKRLINLLAMGTRESWNPEHNADQYMGHFRRYGLKDVLTMRDVWTNTRPLTAWEWAEYHSSERINDHGVAVDVEFAAAAQQYAMAETQDLSQQIADVTGDPMMTVNAHTRKSEWLHTQLWPDPELQEIVERPPNKATPEKPRFSCDRATRETVQELLNSPEHGEAFEPDHLANIVRFLEIIEAGNSAAVKKFTAIVNQAFEGRVYGGYSFNGGGQTGRFSHRGIQLHNLIRDPVAKGDPNRAIDAVEDIMAGMPPNELQDKYDYPVSRLLARLIRPTLIAADGMMLVWGDWDQIEARKLPWLSRSTGGDAKLNLFRSGQDVYKYAAAGIFHIAPDQIGDDSTERQVGKVAELALGFGGSTGAFTAMGRNYGIIVPTAEQQRIVDSWRNNNAWCVDFWNQLWGAAIQAFQNPGNWYEAGRVRYMFHPALMGGTLICQLPCTRWLVYPQFRHRKEVMEDEDGNEYIKLRTSYVRGFGGNFGRVDLWRGKLAENVTQASAASILRHVLTRTDRDAVLHTHDEIVLEVPEDEAERTELWLQDRMTDLPAWAEDCPLTASVEHGPFYTK